MAHASSSRRSMVLALLATTAAASLLGACGQTGGLFTRNSGADEVQMTATEAASATSQWAVAYAKNPDDPQMALGYAKALRAIGSKERSIDILKKAYRANPKDGQVAAELGRVALEANRVDIATHALKTAESQGVTDWKTLSAQGTLHAKKGEHAKAQQYFQAALEQNPDSASVVNNLALSYALDGKADESEALLRKAAENGQDDKRIRQNLALVLGVQGKFEEAREVAAVDMTEDQAKSSMSYLRNMTVKPTQVASAETQKPRKPQADASDWSPFGYDEPTTDPVPVRTASQTTPPKPSPSPAKVQVVKPVDEITAPGKPTQTTAAPAAPATPTPAKAVQVAETKPTSPAVRAKIIRVPEKLPIVRASVTTPVPARTTVAKTTEATKPAPAQTTVALAHKASPKPTKSSAPARGTRAEVVIPVTPPTAKTDRIAGIPKQTAPKTVFKADVD